MVRDSVTRHKWRAYQAKPRERGCRIKTQKNPPT